MTKMLLNVKVGRLIKNKKNIIKHLIVVLILFIVSNRIALALPQVPLSLYGIVQVNNANVPDGTLISAWCSGVKYKETATKTQENKSWYYENFDIPGDDPTTTNQKEGCTPGETVVLKINENPADQTYTWISGSFRLDLTISSLTPTHCLPLGDIDCSGQVGILDLSALLANFGKKTGDAGFNLKADLDNSGEVTILDLSQLLGNFGRSSP